MRRVVVIGSGVSGTAAALVAARGGADVTLLARGTGASVLSGGALDRVPWEDLPAGSPREASGEVDEASAHVLAVLDGYVVSRDQAVVATVAGILRPASGVDRAVLDLAMIEGKSILVPVCDHDGWDGAALARAWRATRHASSHGLRFIASAAPLLRHIDESHLRDAELAGRHDEPERLAWLGDRLREMRSRTAELGAIVLPPWLGLERERATALTADVGVACGEALGGVGGPSGIRFERARDRALLAAGVNVVRGRAAAVTHAASPRESDLRWRVRCAELDVPPMDADAVVLAMGGVLGGGFEYTPSAATFGNALPVAPRPLLRMTCDAPGLLGADGRALEDLSSLFGAAPEMHAWPHVERPLLDRAGLLTEDGGRVAGAPEGLFAVGELAADVPHTWLAALASGAKAGALAAS